MQFTIRCPGINERTHPRCCQLDNYVFIAIKGKEHLVKHLIPPHFKAKVPEESCQCYLIPESVPNLPRIKKKRYQVKT